MSAQTKAAAQPRSIATSSSADPAPPEKRMCTVEDAHAGMTLTRTCISRSGPSRLLGSV